MSQSLISEDEDPSFGSISEDGEELEDVDAGSSCPEPAVGDHLGEGSSRPPFVHVHITAPPVEVTEPPKLRRSSRIASQTSDCIIVESTRPTPTPAPRRKRKLKSIERPATRSVGTQSDSPPPRLRKMMQRSGGAVTTRRRQVGKGKPGPTRPLNQQGITIREEEPQTPPAAPNEEEEVEDAQSS